MYQQSDCTGATPVLDSATTGCRARVATDCTGATPVLAGNDCRARVATDCVGATPVFENAECRARVATDCIAPTPVLDGNDCRTLQQSDCDGTANPKFDATTKTCVATVTCALDADKDFPVGTPGDCGTTLAGATECQPVCINSLEGAGKLSCSDTGIVSSDFTCSLLLTVKMSGITATDFEQDAGIATVFQTTVAEVAGDTINSDAVHGITFVSAEGSTSVADVSVKITIGPNVDQAAVKTAIETAVTAGTFTSSFQTNLKSSAITSVDADQVSADAINQDEPSATPGAGPNQDGDASAGTNGTGGDSNSTIGVVIGVVVVLVVVVIVVWYFKFRKPSVPAGSNKLESPTKSGIGANDLELELEAPVANDNGAPVTFVDK